MTLISWNGGPIFRNGAVGTEQACCCDQPPPPPNCDPCLNCEFPDDQSETTFAEPTGQCAVNYFGGSFSPSQRSKSYARVGSLPTGITWKPGAQAAIDSCNWALVTDYKSRTCCCAIPVEFGQTWTYSETVTRYRLLIIVCPEGEDPSWVDVTDDYLDGDFEQEFTPDPADNFFGPCLSPPECYDFPAFFPDEDPICNEFP